MNNYAYNLEMREEILTEAVHFIIAVTNIKSPVDAQKLKLANLHILLSDWLTLYKYGDYYIITKLVLSVIAELEHDGCYGMDAERPTTSHSDYPKTRKDYEKYIN